MKPFQRAVSAFLKSLALLISAVLATWRWLSTPADERSALVLVVCVLMWALWLLTLLYTWSTARRNKPPK
ncbi:UNVERIFIED_ORG: hypothetical protein HNP28_003336 [Comamonas terrigena]